MDKRGQRMTKILIPSDESGEVSYYGFEVEYEPVFYVYKNKD